MGDLLPQYLWSGLKSSFAECADLSALGKRRQSPHSRLRLPDDRVTAPFQSSTSLFDNSRTFSPTNSNANP